MKNKTTRLAYLDGLRGVAAVLVVIHHFMIAFYPASYTRGTGDIHTGTAIEWLLHDTPLGIVINGGFAVAIFLVLSGFVASIQFKRASDPIAVTDSILKRFIRFFLPISFINVVAYWLLYFDQRWNIAASDMTLSYWWLGTMWKTTASVATVINQSVGSLFGGYSLEEVYNSSVWTMPYFFLGAVMVSLTLLLTSHISKRMLVYVVLILVFIRTNYWLLFVGMVLEQYFDIFKKWFEKPILKFGLVPVVLFLGNYPQYYSTAVESSWYGWLPVLSFAHTSSFYHGIAAICLLLLINTTGVYQKIFSAKLWLFLGKISFSLYLFHILVINTVTSWLFIQFMSVYPYSISVFFSVLLSLPVILVGSLIIYNLTEKHSGTLFNFIRKWLIQ